MSNPNTESLNKKWLVFPDASIVAEQACKQIIEQASAAIKERGVFRIVLAGGTTPENIYKMLSKEKCDWSHWEIYLGDERCLPITSKDRNSLMAYETWLKEVDIPKENIHFIPAELGAEKAAKDYAETIKEILPFDFVLLGMGEDGHTASLFPGHSHDAEQLTHAVYNSPKPPSDRVSLSESSLSNAHQVLMIVTGSGKLPAVKAWKAGVNLPIAQISALKKLSIMLDEAAYPTEK